MGLFVILVVSAIIGEMIFTYQKEDTGEFTLIEEKLQISFEDEHTIKVSALALSCISVYLLNVSEYNSNNDILYWTITYFSKCEYTNTYAIGIFNSSSRVRISLWTNPNWELDCSTGGISNYSPEFDRLCDSITILI